ncbi:alpha-ketoglutarate-dependent dioxygenase AlkB [Mesobaculum littorinae]|uniref:Alpha-ketoglutarate-dependent dioxygenase AlkB n=1 Tax=Mesobaculum littorinae TaxID=2486419 RepID=A0A438AH11_9RHOB|nr:alpha-ketoglutarate-dependent dioxygenase AlkB [Mesobaculum littorinae]RVV97867.1 alpha-ketoglutarate-dependent dioxygenase AlkB [Mesobaculum littorinae]
MTTELDIRGFRVLPGALDRPAQETMLAELRDVIRAAPLVHPETRWGKKMTVRMTSAGRLGWITDRRGYRYEPRHPQGTPWPPIPGTVLDLWDRATGLGRVPDSCLVNFYGEGARMGLHQDRDEGDFTWPVLSLSLGDDALFRMGGTERGGSTDSIWLHSGDVVVIGGAARLAYHGVDRIRFGTSTLLPQGGRVNVTLRVVDRAGDQSASEQHPA